MHHRSHILIGVLLILACLSGVGAFVLANTGPDAPGAEIAVFPLPGASVQIEAQPAQVGAAGYLELWYLPSDGNNDRPLLRIYGVAALPAPVMLPVMPTATPAALREML